MPKKSTPSKQPKTNKNSKNTESSSPKKNHEDVFVFDEDQEAHVKSENPSTTKEVVFEDSFGEQDERFADDLAAMYESDGDKADDVDMNTFDQKRKRGKMIAMGIGAVVLLAIISYMGYLIFHSVASDQEAGKIDFAIQTSEEIASGEVITVELPYTNEHTAPISGDIELFYPSGFIYQRSSVEPNDGENNSFHIEALEAGETETLTITGQLVGSTDDEKEFSALLTYRPENFSSDFQENASTKVKTTSSLINVSIEAPDQVQSGEEFTYTAEFENTSDSEMTSVKAMMIAPEGFTVKSSEPESTEDDDEWFFETISAESSEKITVTGTLAAESGSTEEFTFQICIQESDDTCTLQAEETIDMTVVNPEIDLSLDVVDVASAGSTIPVNVTVDNTSESALQNVEVLLSVDEGFFDSSESTLSIDELPAGESTTLTADVTIQESPTSVEREGKITATIPSAFIEGATLEFPNEASATVKLQGTFTATVSGGFSDSERDVPTVGETSFYTIYWNIENGGETVEGFSMATSLPTGVEWAGNASNGIVYDSGTGEVSYEKETLAGDFEKELSFTVSVTPESSDIGRTLGLTTETTAIGVDGFTGQDISFSYPAVQTDQAVVRSSSDKTNGNNDLVE